MGTPKTYFEETLAASMAKNPDKAKSVDAIYQFDISGDNGGTWSVDLTADADWISEGPTDNAQCTIGMTTEDFMDMVEGRLDGTQAFMMGKLKIEGDMGLAMKLTTILS